MRKKIIIIIIIAAIALIGIRKYLNERTVYNDGYVNGNISGNLYNGGRFCEIDGIVYYSNPNDNGYLYSMNADGSDSKLVYKDNACYINADEHYVYYCRNNSNESGQFSFMHINENSLCRVDRKTKSLKILDSSPSMYLSLSGNYLYYLRYDDTSATTLYRIGIDGENKTQLDTVPYYPCAANNEYLYFTGQTSDHNIYQYNTETNTKRTLLEGNYWTPEITDPAVYFLDCANNFALCTLDFTTGQVSQLTKDSVDEFVVYGNWIYYTRMATADEESAICRMSINGLNNTVILTGDYKNLCVTSTYTYFTDYSGDMTYKTPTEGSVSISVL